MASPEDPDGTELQLALNGNPAAKAYQQAMFQQGQPAAMFFTDDVQADYERMKARGAGFTMPPTDVTASKIAMLNDTCANLIQVTQLKRWREDVQRHSGRRMNEFIEIRGARENKPRKIKLRAQLSMADRSSRLRRSGSARISISTIFPRAIVKPITANSRPSGRRSRSPTGPFTRTT